MAMPWLRSLLGRIGQDRRVHPPSVPSEFPATCGHCGAPRSADEVAESPRPPCPSCGATNVCYSVTITESLSPIADLANVSLTPAAQGRDWRMRWKHAQEELARLTATHTEPLSGDA